MILTCSQCDTRYAVDAAQIPAAGRTVRCAKCGHSWHQGAVPDAPPPDPDPVAVDPPPPIVDIGAAPIGGFAPVSLTPAAAEQPSRWPLIRVVMGWGGLIGLVLALGVAGVVYRQDIVMLWPQSAGVYSSLGLKVNPVGVDLRNVAYRRESQDDQTAMVVTGLITNTSGREQAVPQTVRVTLSDASSHELYHWTFKPAAQTLKPGQSVSFATRLSNPPDAARHLEVRFVRNGG